MTQIRTLFDAGKDIQRAIEKVMTYQASQEQRLKAEISEYIVTESIEHQLEQLLEKMQAAMEAGASHEIGVWVSGFYGSGKSSFTKYLGLAFDERVTVDGVPFLRHLQNRVQRPTTRALLSKLAASFPAAVVMLDLASEQIAGATLAEVSTVLYYKVLQYAGYSRNLKVAALERRLRKEGRYSEFEAAFREVTGAGWADYRNDELVVDSVVPGLAHRLYPNLFRTEHAFTTASGDTVYLMDDRVQEMIDIVREASGREHIIFVVDEIGQYVGSQQNKILDLQGLAQNLKDLGGGKVWILGTAQQTLTEDDPRAAINSPELYKLKDRFPITVALESSDIKEICFRRLLGKSSGGAATLGALFDQHGQALRQHTKLTDAKFYDAGFNRETFVNLYPFLPAHFDILLHLLGALAKSTGGIGLRSAIKVIQDVLVEGAGSLKPVADEPVGWLATTVTLYDALERDIRRAFPSVHQAVEKALIRFPDDEVCKAVSKTVAVLQILGNLPVSVENVAALMHPSVAAPSIAERVKQAVDALLKDPIVPLGEKDGSLRFFSEKLNDVELERSQLALRSPDVRRIFNEALKELFEPLPSARVHGTLSVTSGLRHLSGGQQISVAGGGETVQTVVSFADAADYEAQKVRFTDESRQRSSENVIFLLARRSPEADDLVAEIYRCQRIAELHRHDPDQEVKEYCHSQVERASRLAAELGQKIARSLAQGSFVFRGKVTAVDSLDQAPLAACRKHLAEAAERVFDRYQEAPERVGMDLAERFLRAPNLRSVTSQLDPLGLVQLSGGNPSIRTDQKGLVSIKDFIERSGTVEGKRLLDHFSGPPFGWSPDTVRYMTAALLVAGEVKLKVSGREVTVAGQQAIEALKTNNTFKSAGVALRDDRPSMEVLARAAERLTELAGEPVVPLEEDIGKAAQKLLPSLQNRLGPLAEQLRNLGLRGVDTVRTVNEQIANMLLSDASDAPQRFGAEQAPLYDGLKWAISASVAFGQGVAETVKGLRELERGIGELPMTGVPKDLREAAREDLEAVADLLAQEDFFKRKADLSTRRTAIEVHVAAAVAAMRTAQGARIRAAEGELALLPEWAELTAEEQAGALAEIQALSVEATPDIAGLKALVARQFDIDATISETRARVVEAGLRPVQLSRFDFAAYGEAKKAFSRDEWIDVVLRSVGLEPSKLSPRVKLHFIARLAPLVEPNFNFIELGPRGTGKSYFFSEFSPYSTLISGGQATKSVLFYNNARHKIGLVGFWDTVAFDEVGGIKVKDPDTIQIMKDFMANGRFSRGVEVIADASMAFVGNIDMSVEQIVNSTEYDLFQPLPEQFDLAVMDRFACYLPGWEMPKNSSAFLTDRFGLITDYLAEAFHYQMKHSNRYEEVSKRVRFGTAVEGRDEKGIKKTLCAILKILHPADSPSDEEFDEYVAYAVECRRRVKEQMNKRKPDDEFARIDLSYFNRSGREVVVHCPESVGASATLEPARRRRARPEAGQADNKRADTPEPTSEAPRPASEQVRAQAEGEPAGLQELHYTIQYGDVGHTYETILGAYLLGTRELVIEDPYIRAPHQVANFVRFCETVVKAPTVRRIKLVTSYDEKTDLAMVRERLEELKQSLLDFDVVLEIELNDKLHDREIRTDTGWVVKIGRGLDFYQKPDGWSAIGANDFSLRRCLETKVDVFRSSS